MDWPAGQIAHKSFISVPGARAACRATMAPPPPDAWADLPVFEKDLYMEHPAVTARSEAETRAFRAATGITENLTYVSPKSARAVSADAAEPFKHVLLRLPGFLIDTGQTASWPDIADGLRLTGFFLDRQVFAHTRECQAPPARGRLVDLIRNEASV